jgi:hypothetical protein
LGVQFNSADAGLKTPGANASPVGISGSLARFAIVNNYLYTVGNASLNVLDINAPENPVQGSQTMLSWGVETIYPFKDKLFVGSNNGMYIFSLANPASPQQSGTFSHARTCDPVIADDNVAYVTLRSGTRCQGFTNQLDVINILNIQSPILIKSYPLTNPRGLSKDGSLLFICDEGLQVFQATDPSNLIPVKHFSLAGANDVIAFNNIALVVTDDGLYQYDYSNPSNINLISTIPVQH